MPIGYDSVIYEGNNPDEIILDTALTLYGFDEVSCFGGFVNPQYGFLKI